LDGFVLKKTKKSQKSTFMSDEDGFIEAEGEGAAGASAEEIAEAEREEALALASETSGSLFDSGVKLSDLQMDALSQLRLDADMWRGMEIFLDNNIKAAQAQFATQSRRNPLYLLGVSAVEAIAAVLSLERAQLDKASRVLAATEAFAASVLPRDFGGLVSLGKWMFGAKANSVSNAELRCRVIRAEASLVLGFLQLFQESVVSYVRAGINLRAAWKGYAHCYSIIGALSDDERRATYDFHTIGGIEFGMGAINLAISSLPSKVIRLVSIFGLPHDRAAGFELLRKAVAGYAPTGKKDDVAAGLDGMYQRDDVGNVRGVRSPLAALMLCGYYLLIPQFAPVLTDEYVPTGLALLQKELKLHPKSATHWWLYGRAHRSQRRLRKSGEAFVTAARGGVDFVQIVHLNYYELGFNCLFGQRWAEARSFFDVLLRDNTWSRSLYCYVMAVCEAMCGNADKAKDYYAKAPSYIDRTYGGRVLSVEQFVQRRCIAHTSRTTGSARLDAIELCYLWNGFPQTPFQTLQKFLSMVEDSEDALLNDLAGPEFANEKPPVDADDDDDVSTPRAESTSSASLDADTLAMLAMYKKLPRGERAFDFGKVRARTVRAKDSGESDDMNFAQLASAGKLEDLAIHWLVRACLLKELKRHADAELLYERIVALEKTSLIKTETWIFPWSLFDYASLKYAQAKFDDTKQLLDRVQKFSNFSFEYRLYLRAHLLTKATEERTQQK
jgi:hypothetical protein